MPPTPQATQSDPDEIEIQLTDIEHFLKTSRRRIGIGALIGLVAGSIYAFSQPDLYTASLVVMPEIQAKGGGNLGNLGSLAGLAGINLDNVNAQDAVRPDLYPNVLQSVPFALSILKQPVYSRKLKAKMSLEAFMNQVYGNKIGMFFTNLFSGNSDEKNNDEAIDPKNFSQAIQLTKEQDGLIKQVQSSVLTTYDKKTGMITLTATQPDPVVAATVARLSLEYLTNYITTYRTEKAHKQVDFLRQRVGEAKSRYQSAEYALSAYRDRNRSIYLNTAKIEEQRLQADYLLEQSVYNELSKQLEQAKIKVQEETPVFKTLEPATVPLRKSGPKRTLLMAGLAVVGGVIGLALALIRQMRSRPKAKRTL